MKIEISDYCVRCGICEDLFPNMFKRNYENHCFDVLVDEITPELEEEAKAAVNECAVAAIKII